MKKLAWIVALRRSKLPSARTPPKPPSKKIGYDPKAKSDGPPVSEVQISAPHGQRIEVPVSASGQVLAIEKKKPKL
jgi:hypothetical protein